MYKSFIFALIFSLLAVSSALCLNIEALEVQGDPQAVLLRATETGEEWWAEVGDEVAGWKIYEISPESVTLIKIREGLPLKTQIPVGVDNQPMQQAE
jgi:hypothetical protein